MKKVTYHVVVGMCADDPGPAIHVYSERTTAEKARIDAEHLRRIIETRGIEFVNKVIESMKKGYNNFETFEMKASLPD